jgi:hypothetical protein
VGAQAAAPPALESNSGSPISLAQGDQARTCKKQIRRDKLRSCNRGGNTVVVWGLAANDSGEEIEA